MGLANARRARPRRLVGLAHIPLLDLDEAQDANKAQATLVKNSIRRTGKIIFVGDDRQAIYTWRGAGVGAFDQLIHELDADELPLTWTFRCPQRVVELARTIVPDLEAGNMLAKQLEYLAGASGAGLVLGAKVPIALTSRADGPSTRVASALLALLAAHHARRLATSAR